MRITVEREQAGQRADRFIRRWISEAPLSFIYKMFRQKDVKVNGRRATIDQILKEGDVLDIYLKPELLEKFQKQATLKPVKPDFGIIYEDEHILVADKPVGLLVHSEEKENRVTLANMFVNYLVAKGEYDPESSYGFTPGPAHRLDRNTSGIVIMGKDLPSMRELLRLFRERKDIRKEYTLLCAGQLPKQGRIEIPLAKDSSTGTVHKASLKEGGKTAITVYTREKLYSEYSLARAEILTGRTHQIRAHFSLIGHPVIGDGKYGDFSLNREFLDLYGLKYQFLHASTFTFLDPGEPLEYLKGKTFVSPLPEQLRSILSDLT